MGCKIFLLKNNDIKAIPWSKYSALIPITYFQDLVNGFDDHHGHPLEEDQEATKLNGLAGTGGYGGSSLANGGGGALSGGGSLSRLPQEVQETFAAILRESILDRRLY